MKRVHQDIVELILYYLNRKTRKKKRYYCLRDNYSEGKVLKKFLLILNLDDYQNNGR